MIFVLATRDGVLTAYPSAQDAEGRFDGLEVEDRVWLFFADDGSPLIARFVRPNRRGAFTVSGAFRLEPALSGKWLQERLEDVKALAGPGATTVEELAEILRVNRAKRPPPGALPRS